MKTTRRCLLTLFALLLPTAILAASCGTQDDPAIKGETNVDTAVCDPTGGPFSLEIDNPYLPFVVGAVHVLEGLEAGTDPIKLETTVLDETVEVAGVTTRVVQAKEWEEGELVAVERTYYAQAPDGTVCAFGGDEDVYDEGEVVGQENWREGEGGAKASVHMPGAPEVGMIFDLVIAADFVEKAEVTHVGVQVETPAGTFDDTITILEEGPSIKKFARDIGMIYDDGIELISY